MKLIIQSDDLGITEAVSCGIEKGVREGVITCTGLFSNMPSAEYALQLMKPYPNLCLGEDMNLVAGYPCADPKRIPSLVQENGAFKTSGMHRAIDEADGNQDHVIYEDCVVEMDAQVRRFIEIAGKKPEYLHGHSYSTPAVWKAMEAIGAKYEIPLVRNMHQQFGVKRLSGQWNKKPFPLEDQMKADPMAVIESDKDFLKQEIGFIGTHCGYVDAELFQVSTYTLIRNRDLQAVTGKRMKNWLCENQIELISYRDLLRKEA